jgi:response regulator RpfG family c-di-GMP phosphodiesterase
MTIAIVRLFVDARSAEKMAEQQQQAKAAAEKSLRRRTGKLRILIVDEHPGLRKTLTGLINEKIEVESCIVAENVEAASRAVECEPVDFALVDVSSSPKRSGRIAESLKLRCPMLPVMAVSIASKNTEDITSKKALRPEHSERILAGVRYMQSLVNCGLLGFSIFVKVDDGL